MQEYDYRTEFGIDEEQYDAILDSVNGAFDSAIDVGYDDFEEGEDAMEEQKYQNLLDDPAYVVVYEKHGWEKVKEFFEECSDVQDGAEYAMLFLITKEKAVHGQAFLNTAISLMLARNEGKKRSFTANLGDSTDGKNHFWLLKRIKSVASVATCAG